MSDNEACRLKSPTRTPWNKGKLMGAKPPLRPKHVWSIRTRLMVDGRVRDLAMFNFGHRQQVARLRRGGSQGRGRGTKWLPGGARDDSTEENGTTGQVRAE